MSAPAHLLAVSELDVGEQVKLLLLKCVHDGHVGEYCGFYFDDGARIWFHAAERAYSAMVEVGRIELVYPPDSGARRQNDYPRGELVRGVHFGLTDAERTRRAVLTELGMREYKALLERANPAS